MRNITAIDAEKLCMQGVRVVVEGVRYLQEHVDVLLVGGHLQRRVDRRQRAEVDLQVLYLHRVEFVQVYLLQGNSGTLDAVPVRVVPVHGNGS